ncbi:MAG: AAA family ATPase [Myxococcota bacterium]
MATDEAQQRGERGGAAAESGPLVVPAVEQRGRLIRLKINRFRNVVSGTELYFDEGVNILLGRNGTGKTTLLELIAAVVRGDLRAYERHEFDIEFDLLFGGLSWMVEVRSSLSNSKSPKGVTKPSWYYRVRVEDAGEKIFATSVESARANGEQFSPFDLQFYVGGALAPSYAAERKRRIWSSISSQLIILGNCLRLDEGLDIFRCITGHEPLPGLGIPMLLYVPSEGLKLSPDNKADRTKALEILSHTTYIPPSVIDVASPQMDQLQGRMEIDFDAEQLEFISTAIDLLRVKELRLRMRLMHSEQRGHGGAYSAFGRPAFWITTHQGSTFTHERLSYGEKRLLAFLYHAAANPDILVADELVNGLHYEWIQACLDSIRGQAFLTSQNPLLIDHLPFSSAAEVQRRFVLCDRDEQGNWSWRNMSSDDADAFFRAYEVGIQHVSEILETRGLW